MLLSEQHSLVLFREVFSFFGKRANGGVFRQILLVHPRELRKHLQVAPVAGAPVRHACFRAPRACLGFELGKSWPPADEIFIYLERAFQRVALLVRRQRLSRRKDDFEPWFLEPAAGVFLNLLRKQRNDIERCVHSREFLEDFHHPPVVLQRVQPRPGQQVLPRGRIAILRLVHVPEDNEVYTTQSASPDARMCSALLCAFSIDILLAK